MPLPRCPKCHAPSARKGATWMACLEDIWTLSAALSEACETLEETIPGWERSLQWKRLQRALCRADFWRRVAEDGDTRDAFIERSKKS